MKYQFEMKSIFNSKCSTINKDRLEISCNIPLLDCLHLLFNVVSNRQPNYKLTEWKYIDYITQE